MLTKGVRQNIIKVSNDTKEYSMPNENKRIETELEVNTYIAKLRHAINNGATINFQTERVVDNNRDIKHTNAYTVATLFPEENPVDALKKELLSLTSKEYMCTVKDMRFPKRSEMRVFGKTYNFTEEVYIKIRVELVDPSNANNHTTFVMSFHFAEKAFKPTDFPYRNGN